MNEDRNFYERLEFERNWLKNAVSVTYWNDIDVALNAISAKYTETIEDIKAEIEIEETLSDDKPNTAWAIGYKQGLQTVRRIVERYIGESCRLMCYNYVPRRKPHKCGECKWLSDEHCSVGYKCVNPERKWRTRVAMWKYKHTPACRMFGIKAESEDKG